MSASDGRQRMKLRDFLKHHADLGTGGLEWINRDEMILKIPWQHGGKQAWKKEDAIIFEEWAKLKCNRRHENYVASKRPTILKENFRNALKKGRGIKELSELHDTENTKRPYRVYQLLPNTDTIRPERSPVACNQTSESQSPGAVPIPSVVEIKSCDSGSVPVTDETSATTAVYDLSGIPSESLLPFNPAIDINVLNSGNLQNLFPQDEEHTTASFEELNEALREQSFRSRSDLGSFKEVTRSHRRTPPGVRALKNTLIAGSPDVAAADEVSLTVSPDGALAAPDGASAVPQASPPSDIMSGLDGLNFSDNLVAMSSGELENVISMAAETAGITAGDMNTPVMEPSDPFAGQLTDRSPLAPLVLAQPPAVEQDQQQNLLHVLHEMQLKQDEAQPADAATITSLPPAIHQPYQMTLDLFYNGQHVTTWTVPMPGACCIFYESMDKSLKHHQFRSPETAAMYRLELLPEWSASIPDALPLIEAMKHGLILEGNYDGIFATRYCRSAVFFSNFFNPNDSKRIERREATCIYGTQLEFEEALQAFCDNAKEPSDCVQLGFGVKWNFGEELHPACNLISIRVQNGYAAAQLDTCKKNLAAEVAGVTPVCISSLSDDLSSLGVSESKQVDQ